MKARKKLSERVGKDDYGLKKGGRNQIFPKTLLYIKNNVYLCDSNQNLQNMTKRILLSIFAMIALTTAAAQDVVSGFRFGYLSYEAALKAMPDYELVQQKMDQMRQQFQAETLLLAPLKIRLIEQLGTIARERGYAFIVDTDQKALPYINPSMGEDITLTVQDALK